MNKLSRKIRKCFICGERNVDDSATWGTYDLSFDPGTAYHNSCLEAVATNPYQYDNRTVEVALQIKKVISEETCLADRNRKCLRGMA